MIDSLHLMRCALDQLTDGVIIADEAGVIREINQRAQQLLGRYITRLDQLPDLYHAPNMFWNDLQQHETVQRVHQPLGKRPVLLSATPLRGSSGTLAGAVITVREGPPLPTNGADLLHLDAMARSIASGRDIKSILERTFGYLQPLIGCDNISLAVAPEEQTEAVPSPSLPRFLTLRPTPLSTIRISNSTGTAINRVLTSAQPIVVNDTAAATYPENRLLFAQGIRSYAIYPLHGEQGIIGTLNLSSHHRHAFGDRQNTLIGLVASHIALAVEKILLLESTDWQRRFLDSILQNIPAGVVVAGPPPDLRILHANRDFRAFLTGSEHIDGEIVGLPLVELHTHLDDTLIQDQITHTFTTGKTAELTDVVVRGLRPYATYWNLRFVPLRYQSNKVEAVITLLAETTEQVQSRRQIEDLARTAAQQATALSTIIESMAEGVFVCDTTGRMVLINEVGARLFGISPDQTTQDFRHFTTANPARYTDGRPVPPEDSPLARGLRGETRVDWEQIIRHPETGDDLYLRVDYSPIRDERGEIIGAVSVANDITTTRRLERQREEFLSIAAHELKTPVTSIKLFAQGMLRMLQRRGTIAPERALRDLNTIVGQIERLTDLVDDLLNVSRIRTGQLEYHLAPTDLPALVRAVVERFQAQTEDDARHQLHLEVSDAIPPLHADAARLDQVLTNLLTNAFKYSPEGGTIRVTVDLSPEPGRVRISVSDEGVGLTEEEISQLFMPFSRAASPAHRNIAGIGLGLYISHEIVKRHGGRIWAESKGTDRGASFIVELPLPEAADS